MYTTLKSNNLTRFLPNLLGFENIDPKIFGDKKNFFLKAVDVSGDEVFILLNQLTDKHYYRRKTSKLYFTTTNT